MTFLIGFICGGLIMTVVSIVIMEDITRGE